MKKVILTMLAATMLLTACTRGNTSVTDGTSADTTEGIDTTDAVDTTHIDNKKIFNFGNITVIAADSEICVFKDDELISENEIKELYLTEYLGEAQLFAKIPWENGGYAFHSIDGNGISEDFILGNGFFSIHNNYIVTELSVYDLDKHLIFNFDAIIESPEISETEVGIMIKGQDIRNKDVTYTYSKNTDFEAYSDFEIVGDKITETTVKALYNKFPGSITKVINTSIDDLHTLGDYKVYDFNYTSTNFIKDGVVVKSFDKTMDENMFGDFYYINSGYVYNKDLEKISDCNFRYFTGLSDGRYIALTQKTSDELPICYIFDASGNILFEGNNGYHILHADADYILAIDETDRVVLLTPDFEKLCTFSEEASTYSFHSALSGQYVKDGKLGYYFVFEDSSDTDEAYNSHSYEYYYIPETGESGRIDNGYAPFAYAKPVLYLYPTEVTEVSVKFEHPERLTTVYPKYNGGWKVIVSPDGTLKDKNGRSYYALYWEESSENGYYKFSDGFCVASEDSAAFLEEKLEEIGFTELEANEFIIYWLPILEQNEYNLIRFELTDEREASNALIISPKPDSLLRMAMHIKGLSSPIEIREQPLPEFERNGFTAVEWGGCIH